MGHTELKKKEDKTVDIAFIGSGIATSFTLIPLFEKLIASRPLKKELRIAIIEKDKEPFTGLAYGPRSGASALLITSLADFLPVGPERSEFISWLNLNKSELVKALLEDGGDLSMNWVRAHREEMEAGDWEDIYLPRRFFGKYILDKVQKLIKEVTQKQQVKLEYFLETEVLSINRLGEGYRIQLNGDNGMISAEKVVLSVGIPPKEQLWTREEETRYANDACFVSRPYHISLNDNLNKINSFVSKRDQPSNVLIIGSNASAMEMIYKLNDTPAIKSKIGSYVVISPQGSLPNSAQDDYTRMVSFNPENLNALKSKQKLTAWEIYKAANLDLDVADDLGFGTAISEAPISSAFISLLEKLDSNEMEAFACHYGNEIGKRQRRAGKHYTDVVDMLMATGRLTNIKGYFKGLISTGDADGLRFSYQEENGKTGQQYEEPIHVFLSCVGGKTLDKLPLTPLMDQLVSEELCEVNPSRRGFKVNDELQSAPGFYIAGPLLAGNVIKSVPFWHLEHCGRIIALGNELGNELFEAVHQPF